MDSIKSSSFLNNISSAFSNVNDSNSNTSNKLDEADNTLSSVRSSMIEQAQQLGNLQDTLDSVSNTVSNNGNVNINGAITGELQTTNYDSTIIAEQRVSHINNLKNPKDLEKKRKDLFIEFKEKVLQVKELFVLNKLNDDGSYKQSYELSTSQLEQLKKKIVDLESEITRENNKLNLRLSSIDEDINRELRKRNTLEQKINDEQDEDFSFTQMKQDEVREYRLNIYYLVGIFLGSGLVIKKIMNMGKGKRNNEAMRNMIITINGQEESSRKEMDMRLNEYMILVVVALSVFGILLFQTSQKKK